MALKPTIYKAAINLSDMDRHFYGDLNLTIAQHPSETLERMAARVLAYCLNAHDDLQFSRGLSNADEPAVWLKSLDDQILTWIDVGQPEPERLKKASTRAREVKVYSFAKSADTWWSLNQAAIGALSSVSVFRFDWRALESLAQRIERNLSWSVSISENTLYITDDSETVEVQVETWRE